MEKVNKADTEEQFAAIRNEKGNNSCFDCGREGPTWVSLRHAVFVCTGCAARHRAIGYRLKSVLLDTFTRDEMRRVRLGGNFSFEEDDFARRYERLEYLPKMLDDLVASGADPAESPAAEEDQPRLSVRQKAVPRLARKAGPVQRRPERAEEKKAAPKVRKAAVETTGLVVNRKEYRVGGASASRMGFGAPKIRKTDEDAE